LIIITPALMAAGPITLRDRALFRPGIPAGVRGIVRLLRRYSEVAIFLSLNQPDRFVRIVIEDTLPSSDRLLNRAYGCDEKLRHC
jgi:hypothetical protein